MQWFGALQPFKISWKHCSVVECSPATRAARVRFPDDAVKIHLLLHCVKVRVWFLQVYSFFFLLSVILMQDAMIWSTSTIQNFCHARAARVRFPDDAGTVLFVLSQDITTIKVLFDSVSHSLTVENQAWMFLSVCSDLYVFVFNEFWNAMS